MKSCKIFLKWCLCNEEFPKGPLCIHNYNKRDSIMSEYYNKNLENATWRIALLGLLESKFGILHHMYKEIMPSHQCPYAIWSSLSNFSSKTKVKHINNYTQCINENLYTSFVCGVGHWVICKLNLKCVRPFKLFVLDTKFGAFFLCIACLRIFKKYFMPHDV